MFKQNEPSRLVGSAQEVGWRLAMVDTYWYHNFDIIRLQCHLNDPYYTSRNVPKYVQIIDLKKYIYNN